MLCTLLNTKINPHHIQLSTLINCENLLKVCGACPIISFHIVLDLSCCFMNHGGGDSAPLYWIIFHIKTIRKYIYQKIYIFLRVVVKQKRRRNNLYIQKHYLLFSQGMKIYYSICFGYYSYCFVAQFFEVKRKDFWEMFIHHLITFMFILYGVYAR
jgi:hypothetical protein